MKSLKLTALILLISSLMGIFTGCLFTEGNNGNKSNIEHEYQAYLTQKQYNSSKFSNSFLSNNKIYAKYKDGDGNYILEENAPKTRTFTVENPDAYKEIFTVYESGVMNFDEEILYLHIFRNWHYSKHYLDEISIIDDTLHIYIKDLNTTKPNEDSSKYIYGLADCFIVKMKKTGVSKVEFHIECDICDSISSNEEISE